MFECDRLSFLEWPCMCQMHPSRIRLRFLVFRRCSCTMVLVQEARHPRSLDFANERKAMLLRDAGHAWKSIAGRVKNLSGTRHPSSRTATAPFRKLCALCSGGQGGCSWQTPHPPVILNVERAQQVAWASVAYASSDHPVKELTLFSQNGMGAKWT